ncbi:hypothetical protein EYR36_008093 [Pleurotus pulmonarius]|nr:hypothetical protein EYR36_008093 [Pleurotus pulmonarius]
MRDAIYRPCHNSTYGKLQWTSVARVCRKWRTIALNSPSLWTRLHHLSERSLEEVAKRYPDAPLDIDCSAEELKTIIRVFGGDAIRLFQRIRRLTFAAGVFIIDNTILSHPPPVLQSLTLSGPCNVPDSFFDVHIPSLKSISLRLNRVPLDSHLLSDLHQLTLSGNWASVRKNTEELFFSDDFLSLLERQPHLRALDFTFPTNTSAYAAPLQSKTVDLPLLRVFSIAGSQHDQGPWFQILEHINCPRLESFSSRFTDPPFSPPCHDGFALEAIRAFFMAHGKYSAKQQLVIGRTLIQLYDSFDTPQPHWGLQPRLSIKLDNEFHDAVDWDPFLRCIVERNIAVTCLDCCNLGSQIPSAICDSIKILRLSGLPTLFFGALDDYGCFPSVERICFDRVGFTPRAKTIPAIKRWYSARRKAGGLKVSFDLNLCDISKNNVSAWEKSGCEVNWDGYDRSRLTRLTRGG